MSGAADPPVWTAVIDSPVGPMSVQAGESAVRGLRFAATDAVPDAGPDTLAARAAAELADYFAGALRTFAVAPDWERVDEVSARVLSTLVRVAPFGHTVSYGELAAASGLIDPVAARVVGQVLNANPWPVLVPCHRVVMGDGSLGGFGGGLWRKEVLLRHEDVLPPTLFG